MAEISYKIKKNGAEIEKALERAEKLTGIAGTVVFDDTEEQLLLDSHGWFTNAPGLYSVSGDGFNGVLLIAESGVTEGGQGNVTVSKEPSFVLIGNAAPVSFSPDDPDVFENITSGDPFLPMLFFRRAELSMTVYSPSAGEFVISELPALLRLTDVAKPGYVVVSEIPDVKPI